MSALVKCCGLTRPEDVEVAVEVGVDYLGFVFASSPRQVDVAAAADMALESRRLGFTGGLVGVFVDAAPELLAEAAEKCDLDVLQLHGAESPDAVAAASALRPVWKALPVGADATSDGLLRDASRFPDVDAILLDTEVEGQAGGTGVAFDASVAAPLAATRHVVLAGGLTPENVAEAIRMVKPFGVDVSTGVESAPGIKNPDRMRAFMAAVMG
jgi:phosphoribosylanthranilate isomerase